MTGVGIGALVGRNSCELDGPLVEGVSDDERRGAAGYEVGGADGLVVSVVALRS